MNIAPKVLFIDTVHPLVRERLVQNGYECHWLPGKGYGFYSEIIQEYVGIIIRSGITLDKNILEKGRSLKFIARLGSGLDNIDTRYAETKGISCINSPEGNRDAVAEHTMGMLLVALNKLLVVDREVRSGAWKREENRGTEIKGKSIGIIGYGNMGSAFAQRLKGFECNILAYDKYKSGFGDERVTESTPEKIFDNADIVSLHVPLTEETTYMANSSFFNSFKKRIVFINTSRGGVVNTAELVEAMKQGIVVAAALDVIEYEESSFEMLQRHSLPQPFQYLIKHDNVVLSPHIAGWTHESKIKLAEVLVDKIIRQKGDHF